jgi:hypothetical protein
MGEGERSEMLQTLSDYGSSAVSRIFGGIDWLGARSREIAAGKAYGSAPSGLDVLKSHGISVSEKALGGYGRPLASFATETLLDPLTYTGFGALGGGLSKAGKAAKAVNILDDASRAMSRNLVDDIIGGTRSVDDLSKVGRRAESFWAKEYGKDLTRLTDEDLYARPLNGWREARRDQTLGDILERQKDWGQEHYDETVKSLKDYLYKNGGWSPNPTQQLDDLKNVRLSNDINFMGLGVNLPGGGTAARELDSLGSYIRWSRPGAYVTAGFSRDLHGATDAASQVGTLALSRGDTAAAKLARLKSHNLLSTLPKFKDQATDIRVGNAIRNVIEEVGPTLRGDALTAHDEVLKALTDYRAGTAVGESAQIGKFVDDFQSMSAEYLNRSRAAGIGSSKLADKFGHGHFPRVLDDMTFGGANNAPTAGRTFSVMTGDQMARAKSFHVPGGTNTLQELSLDPMVAGKSRAAQTDEQAAHYILQRMAKKEADLQRAGRLPVGINGKPVTYKRSQAIALARKLHGVSDDAMREKLPIFGNPLESVVKYIDGREKAIRRAGTLTNMLSSSAIAQHAHRVPGGGATKLSDALTSLGLKSTDRRGFMGPLPAGVPLTEGAKSNILDRIKQIGAKNGIPEFSGMTYDELRNVSVDSRLLQRLNRIADFYQVPEVQSQMFKTLDAITSMWKASILSWPARFVRDWYSGMFSNIVEVGNAGDLMNGYAGAKSLIQGQEQKLVGMIGRMPRYRNMAPADRLPSYMSDLAAEGISRGRQLEDVGQTAISRQSSQGVRSELLAGSAPETTLGYQAWDLMTGAGLKGNGTSSRFLPEAELLNRKNWYRAATGAPGSFIDAFKGIKPKETTNPILRWSARLGDTTDKINRIAGYNGLLLQGISPSEAARRIMAAQVDYGSLTKFERGFVRTALPFWAYESRVSKWVLTKIAEKPGGIYTQLGMRLPQRVSENDTRSDYVPRRISDKYGISLEPLRRIPGIGLAVDAIAPKTEGVSSWLSDFDLPGIDQINKVKLVTDMETGSIGPVSSLLRTAGSLAEGANPLLKMAYEAGTGRDSYTGLKKNYLRNTAPVLLERSGMADPNTDAGRQALEYAGYLDPMAQFLVPFYSRTAQLARKASDPRIEDPRAAALQNLINAAAGVKVENIGDDEKSRDALETIKELLDSNPAIRSYETTYIPDELLPFVDERTQRLYQLDRQLRKERRQQAKVKPDIYNPMNY